MTRLRATALAVLATAAIAGCGGDSPNDPPNGAHGVTRPTKSVFHPCSICGFELVY